MRRSKFNLSNYKLFSCDMGELVPCGLTEVLPGDTIQHNTNVLVRCSPLLAPVMHPVDVRIHHWFVPHRIIWNDWEDFITGGPDGNNASIFPTITPGAGGYAVGSLGDYLGVPTGFTTPHSALPFRAYALIWNEWYRDQDLQAELTVDRTEGNDTTTNRVLQHCAWEKDYFTSTRPWEQKGPAITIPLGTSAPTTITMNETGTTPGVRTAQRDGPGAGTALEVVEGGTGSGPISWSGVTDLTGASAVTVNILREALALQRYEEARARFGSRYVEYLRYLGVRSSDARLQRPEYLGGGRQTIQFSEVLATAQGTSTVVGDLKGHGVAAMRSNRYRRFFEEHGYIISLCSVRPKTMYGNGLFRTWNRRTKEDFWQKELEHIGQQEVLRKEVYGAASGADTVFGYQDRYDEYRRSESSVGGEFRSSLLDYWHMARIFASAPALNSDFVKCVPTERTFAVPSQDVLYIMARHSMQARRMVAPVGKSYIY